ncbi:hypothetical protein N2152v2_008380 [Parachlorella kessleri]
MSREEVSAFLRNLQIALDGLQKSIDQSLASLPKTKRDDLPKFLAEQKRRFIHLYDEQLEEWGRFVEEAGLQVEEEETIDEGGGETTPFNVRLRSLEQRVAAMGGIPALGATVLPRMTPAHKAGLSATASPAAVEIMRGRLGGTDADGLTKLRKTSSDETGAATTPLVQLRKTNLGGAGSGGGGGGGMHTPEGLAGPNSELAAAIQRRAAQQRQQEEQQLQPQED